MLTLIENISIGLFVFFLFDFDFSSENTPIAAEIELETIEIVDTPIEIEATEFSVPASAMATTWTTFNAGSLIIDMGVVPQTAANALKPYGLIFDLIKNYDVQVHWVINPNKVSNKNTPYDDIDFSYNGQNFRGGPFIIPVEYRSTAVNLAIDDWILKGVVTVTTASAVTAPIEAVLSTPPNWTLDFANGDRLFDGFIDAEIPEFNDPGMTDPNYVFKTPDQLDCCDYLYAMPHADPVWTTHSNLYTWILPKDQGGCRGWIYSACHAVSALEMSFDDQTPDVNAQMNFLCDKSGPANMADAPWATNSLVHWNNHGDGDGSYDYDNTTYTDPFMQYMGKIDGALDNGSEQVFMPVNGTNWRSTTTVSVYDANQPDVGVISPGPAAQMAYGPAFGVGDYTDYSSGNGWVMYLAGHEIDNTGTEAGVAAYRAFFNFSFMSAFERGATISYVASVPPTMQHSSTITLSATATGSLPPFEFEWSANPNIGTFTNNPVTAGDGVLAEVQYTAPYTAVPLDVIITLSVKDQCNIVAKESHVITILPPELPPTCSNYIDYIGPNAQSILDLTTLTYDPNQNLFPSGFSISGYPVNGAVALDPVTAIATYTPDFNYIGTDTYEYTATDDAGNSCTGVVTIIIDCPTDANNNQIFGTVFHDENQNGIIDGTDYGFDGGALVSLFKDDAPNDGIPDGPAVQDTTTNILGSYNFLVEDTYAQQTTVQFYMGSISDDARERTDGNKNGDVENNKAEINITDDNDDYWNGLRFTNVTIPDGALINSAYIVFTAKKTGSSLNANTRIFGEDNTSNPATYPDCNDCFDISNRTQTSSYVNWFGIPVWIEENQYSSPDLSSIVQEIVDDQSGLTNESMAFILESQGPAYPDRKAYSYDSDPSKAAYLEVTYTIIPPGTNFNYILELNENDLPANYVMTTPSSLTVVFNSLGTSDCQNNFGFYVNNACPIIYSNGFVRYNRLD